MADDEVLVRRDAETLWVTINRPEKRNALSRGVLEALRRAFAAAGPDEALRVAVLTGAGSRAFAAGGDLRDLDGLRGPEEAAGFSDAAFRALEAVRRCPVPVVAALNGDALGGGAELALACDLRILSAEARIGFIQGRLALSTGWGGGPDLMRLVGSARGLSLLLSGRLVSGPEAVSLGLAEAAAETGEPFAAALERFLAPIRALSPLVLRAFKAQALAERDGLPASERRALERADFCRTWLHADHWAAAAAALRPARDAGEAAAVPLTRDPPLP